MTHTLEEVKQQWILDNSTDIWTSDVDLTTVSLSDGIYAFLSNIVTTKVNAIQYGYNNVQITTNHYVMLVNIQDDTFRFSKILTKLFIVKSSNSLNITKSKAKNNSAIVLNKDDFNITFDCHQLYTFLNEVEKVEKLYSNLFLYSDNGFELIVKKNNINQNIDIESFSNDSISFSHDNKTETLNINLSKSPLTILNELFKLNFRFSEHKMKIKIEWDGFIFYLQDNFLYQIEEKQLRKKVDLKYIIDDEYIQLQHMRQYLEKIAHFMDFNDKNRNFTSLKLHINDVLKTSAKPCIEIFQMDDFFSLELLGLDNCPSVKSVTLEHKKFYFINDEISLKLHENGAIFKQAIIANDNSLDVMRSICDSFSFEEKFSLSLNAQALFVKEISDNSIQYQKFTKSLCLIEKYFKERKNTKDSGFYAKIIDTIEHDNIFVKNSWKLLEYGYFENIPKTFKYFSVIYAGVVMFYIGLYISIMTESILFFGFSLMSIKFCLDILRLFNKESIEYRGYIIGIICLYLTLQLGYLSEISSLDSIEGFWLNLISLIGNGLFPFAKIPDNIKDMHMLFYSYQTFMIFIHFLLGLSIKRLFSRLTN